MAEFVVCPVVYRLPPRGRALTRGGRFITDRFARSRRVGEKSVYSRTVRRISDADRRIRADARSKRVYIGIASL